MTRKRLPATRSGRTHKVTISDPVSGDFDLYITSNYHEDGDLGEVFLSAGKMGSTLQGLLDGWAIMLSMAVQYGTPLEDITGKFAGQSFAPSGPTDNPDIPVCTSLLDYVARYIG